VGGNALDWGYSQNQGGVKLRALNLSTDRFRTHFAENGTQQDRAHDVLNLAYIDFVSDGTPMLGRFRWTQSLSENILTDGVTISSRGSGSIGGPDNAAGPIVLLHGNAGRFGFALSTVSGATTTPAFSPIELVQHIQGLGELAWAIAYNQRPGELDPSKIVTLGSGSYPTDWQIIAGDSRLLASA